MDHGDYIKKSSNQNLLFSFSFQHTRCHFQLQAMFLPLMIGTPFEVMKKCCLMKNGLKIVKHLLEAWFTTHTIHPQKQMIILTRYQRKKSGLTNHCTLPIRFRSLKTRSCASERKSCLLLSWRQDGHPSSLPTHLQRQNFQFERYFIHISMIWEIWDSWKSITVTKNWAQTTTHHSEPWKFHQL